MPNTWYEEIEARKQERNSVRRCRFSSDNNDSEMSDIVDGGIVDLRSTKYLYWDETWLQYPTFHPLRI